MRIRFTATALLEIDQITRYVSERNPAAAKALIDRIEDAIDMLADIPEMAQTTDEPGVRRFPLGSFPFLIFYTIESDEVVILHVRHGARRYPGETSR
jgi:plasmid stabilization system protein ParE